MSISKCVWCRKVPKTHKKRAKDGWTDPEVDVKWPYMLEHECDSWTGGIQIHDETRHKCVKQWNEFNVFNVKGTG